MKGAVGIMQLEEHPIDASQSKEIKAKTRDSMFPPPLNTNNTGSRKPSKFNLMETGHTSICRTSQLSDNPSQG